MASASAAGPLVSGFEDIWNFGERCSPLLCFTLKKNLCVQSRPCAHKGLCKPCEKTLCEGFVRSFVRRLCAVGFCKAGRPKRATAGHDMNLVRRPCAHKLVAKIEGDCANKPVNKGCLAPKLCAALCAGTFFETLFVQALCGFFLSGFFLR